MEKKPLNQTAVIGILAAVVIAVIGGLFFALNKDSIGAAGEAKTYNKPGEIPKGKVDTGPRSSVPPTLNGRPNPAAQVGGAGGAPPAYPGAPGR
jgi:hypothetical protein